MSLLSVCTCVILAFSVQQLYCRRLFSGGQTEQFSLFLNLFFLYNLNKNELCSLIVLFICTQALHYALKEFCISGYGTNILKEIVNTICLPHFSMQASSEIPVVEKAAVRLLTHAY